MNVPAVTFTLLYNKKNITQDVSQQVIAIEYNDKVSHESDELSITLEDVDGKWQNEYYPKKGDVLEFQIQQQDRVLNCGQFVIDETEINSSNGGDIFTIKALAASINKSLRTVRTYAHENKSLREIANTVASGLGLSLQGEIKDIRFNRIHQHKETSLQFLNRIGSEYGYIFSVRGDKLIFTYYEDVESRPSSLIRTKQQLVSYTLKDVTAKTFRKARIRHHEPKKKKIVNYIAVENKKIYSSAKNDDLEMHVRAENEQQAEAKVRYSLYKHNSRMVEGDFECDGDILILSGNNIELQKIGEYSGLFAIEESTHTIDREGGYKCKGKVKKIANIDPSKYK